MNVNLKTRLRRWAHKHLSWLIVPAWRLRGSPVPTPHALKQRVLREFAARFGTRRLVETGTYRGDMVDAMRDDFADIHTVEVFQPLFAAATEQFRACGHVHVHLGNSADVFVGLLPTLQGATLFWLDGHYSGEGTGGDTTDVPVMKELEQIGKLPGRHAILIDDAREFTGRNGYPTVEQIRGWASANGYDTVELADDIIRIARGRGVAA